MKDARRPRDHLQLCDIGHARHEEIGNPAIFIALEHVEALTKTKLSHAVKSEVLEPSSGVEGLAVSLFDLGAKEY